MVWIIDVHAVSVLRNARKNLLGRLVLDGQFFVRQNQVRLLSTAEQAIDADAVGFVLEFGLQEADGVRSPADGAPFRGRFFAVKRLMPERERPAKFIADRIDVRAQNDDPFFGVQSRGKHQTEEKAPTPEHSSPRRDQRTTVVRRLELHCVPA